MKFHRFLSLFSFGRPPQKITPHHLQEQLSRPSPPIVLDVRTSEECERGHIAGAVLIPVDDLTQRIGELEPYRHRAIVTV